MSTAPPIERDGARILDIRLREAVPAFLVEPLDGGPITRIRQLVPRPVLLQFAKGDFYIADMTGLELHRAAGDPKELGAYAGDHAMRNPQAREDRRTSWSEA